jgi:hypothetical protein
MKLSERYGSEVMGFVESLALAMAADDQVKPEEVAKAEEAIRRAAFELSDDDRTVLARYTEARAQELVAASFAAIGGGLEELTKLAAQDIIGSDGEVTDKESATLACLYTCLTAGASAAFRSLTGIPENA